VSVLELEPPGLGRIDSYRSLIREFIVRGEPLIPFVLDWPNADAAAFVERCAASARGEGLPEGFVPHSTFWIVEDGREVLLDGADVGRGGGSELVLHLAGVGVAHVVSRRPARWRRRNSASRGERSKRRAASSSKAMRSAPGLSRS